MNTQMQSTLSAEQHETYLRDGYLIVRGLWTQQEVDDLKAQADALDQAGKAIPGYWEPAPDSGGVIDPLKRHPRMLHIHRYVPLAKRMMLDPRIGAVLRGLLNDEPIACQSMVYFKPPGSRGQALHQDNFYLMVKPGSCMAAWTALDPATPDNGGLTVVPGTQDLELKCPTQADGRLSFVNNYVAPPPGKHAVPAILNPGDVLFFNGSVIHGSAPNAHPTMWRRSFICHYLPGMSEQIFDWYFPLHDFNGNVVQRKAAEDGGPCGKDFDWGKLEKFSF
jgi:ectoine hydroxylase-related dioxygenase (phytanoyl-CoA dioxygenase family)